MRQILIGLMVLAVAACGRAAPGDDEGRSVVAALAYAEWCPNCKVLEPKLEAVLDEHSYVDTSFVTLDFTSRDNATFLEAADQAGVGSAVREQFKSQVTTGLLLLVDSDTQEIVGVVDKTLTEDEIHEAIVAASAGS
ncbi:MAG: thioredoxin family protein [Pseudomonadota bacterium]